MISTSESVEKCLLHCFGEQKLIPKPGATFLTEAVELDKKGNDVISSFGNREFNAGVAFLDMRGFSTRAKGKPPTEVRDIVSPFVECVIEVASRYDCVIDKTIGDEVMLVMPVFPKDVLLSADDLVYRNNLIFDLSDLVIDLIERLDQRARSIRFAASAAFGNIILDRIATSKYCEWTVYGNTVNAAKRLQSAPQKLNLVDEDNHWLALGALKHEESFWAGEVKAWFEMLPGIGDFELVGQSLNECEFKGVGVICYVTGTPRRKKDSK